MEEVVRENLGRTHLSLRAIREELEMFEKEIRWRDERLGQLELELQQERARQGGGGDNGALHQRLREARQQLEQHAAVLRERDQRIQALVLKERELLGRIQTLTHERSRSAQALADMVKQIQEQQRRTHSLEEKLVHYQQELQAREEALQRAQSAAPAQPAGMSLGARLALVVCVLLIAGASLAVGVSTLMRAEPRFRVAGQMVLPAEQVQAVMEELRDDPAYARLKTQEKPLGEQLAGLTLIIPDVRGREAADFQIGELDKLGRTLVNRLTPPPPSAPDTTAEREELERRLAGIEQQMSALTTQPAQASLSQEMGLLKTWRELINERQTVESHLKQLRPRLAASRPATVQVDEEALARLELADAQLQANLDMLAAKEQQLRALMDKPLEAAGALFTRMGSDLATAVKDVADAAQDAADPGVTQATDRMTRALNEWSQSLADLRSTWDAARGGVSTQKSDLVALQNRLEPAVRAFMEQIKVQREAIDAALASLAEGGEEPTKRIVLRNGLSRQLNPVLEHQSGVGELLRPLLSSDNAELAGLLQAITGLRAQVTDQRERIAAAAREGALRRAQEEYDRAIAAARSEQERWLKRAAELDEALLEQNRKALELLPQMDGERSAAQRRAELYQERSQVLAQLAELSHREAEALAAQSDRQTPWYIPAEATPLPADPRERLGQAMLFGSIPLGIGALILIAIWAGQLYLRSRQLATDYERLLREAGSSR